MIFKILLDYIFCLQIIIKAKNVDIHLFIWLDDKVDAKDGVEIGVVWIIRAKIKISVY